MNLRATACRGCRSSYWSVHAEALDFSATGLPVSGCVGVQQAANLGASDPIAVTDSDSESDAPDESTDDESVPNDEPAVEGDPLEEEWGEVDLSCETDEDCTSNEVCSEGLCQIDRCSAGDYGRSHPWKSFFFADREIAVMTVRHTQGSIPSICTATWGGAEL